MARGESADADQQVGVPATDARKHVVVFDYGFGNVHSALKALQEAGARVTLSADPQVCMAADGLLVPGVGSFAAVMAGLRAANGPQIIERRLAGGRAVMGICVGMQVMFERGIEGSDAADACEHNPAAEQVQASASTDGDDDTEQPLVIDQRIHAKNADEFWWSVERDTDTQGTAGLEQWPGTVRQLRAPRLPHMGWNTVEAPEATRLFAGIEQERFYFVHSYAVPDIELPVVLPGSEPVRCTYATYGERFVAAVENGPLSATQFHPEKSGAAGIALLRNWVGTL